MGQFILYKHIFAPFSIIGDKWPILIVLFFFSVVIHEVAHGLMAYKCGDNTAKAMGRITLNPLPHIDMFGTIILPAMMFFLGGFIIGWAKPVPINPYNFHDVKKCTIKVGASGILANFALSIIMSLIIWVLNLMGFQKTVSGINIIAFLAAGVSINIVLGIFNLIPIPPLDGSRIVSSLLPVKLAQKYDSISSFGFIILIFTIRIIWPVVITIGNFYYKLLFAGLPL